MKPKNIPLTPLPGKNIGFARTVFSSNSKQANISNACSVRPLFSNQNRPIAMSGLPSMKIDLDSDSDSDKPSSVVTTPTSAGSQHSYRYHGTTSPRARDIQNNGMLKDRKQDGVAEAFAFDQNKAAQHHYFTKGKGDAYDYAKMLANSEKANNKDHRAAVVKIEIQKGSDEVDPKDPSKARRTSNDIPSAKVKKIDYPPE